MIGARARRGQATVEAAVLIPSVLVLMALLVQPACLLYTRAVMRGAAAETARAVLTARGDKDLSACREYALRRLAAVPEAPPFHVGGRGDWQVEISQGSGGKAISVSIMGHARPLPLFSTIVAALGERDGRGVVLRADITERMRPAWLGGDYGTWTEMWG